MIRQTFMNDSACMVRFVKNKRSDAIKQVRLQ